MERRGGADGPQGAYGVAIYEAVDGSVGWGWGGGLLSAVGLGVGKSVFGDASVGPDSNKYHLHQKLVWCRCLNPKQFAVNFLDR